MNETIQQQETQGNGVLPCVTHCLSSYQKLKKENERLQNEIYTLIREADTEKGIMLKMQYNIHYDQIDAIMFGSITFQNTTFGGILSMLTPNEG